MFDCDVKHGGGQQQRTVQTGVGGAVVDFLLAIEAGVSHRALAEVASFRVVGATPAIEARPICTGIGA